MPRPTAIIPEPWASAVGDILETAIELRQARKRAAEAAAKADAEQFSVLRSSTWQQTAAAQSWVHELLARIASRAGRDELDADELLKLANDVIDGRRRLPEGIEPIGMAA